MNDTQQQNKFDNISFEHHAYLTHNIQIYLQYVSF